MFIAYLLTTIATVLANAGVAFADLIRADAVLATSGEVGVQPEWVPALGALKAAGAGGLVLGLIGVPWIGVAAAGGLVLFFVGAIVVHIRARVFHNIAVPACFLALAAGTLVLTLKH